VYSCGGATSYDGEYMQTPHLSHGEGGESVPVPKLVEALAGNTVIGVTAGGHTAVWTDAGELFTFGGGGALGHGEDEYCASVPKLVEALAGKKVVGASTSMYYTAVWTEVGELRTRTLHLWVWKAGRAGE